MIQNIFNFTNSQTLLGNLCLITCFISMSKEIRYV